jgi:hypothetical protein
MSPRDGAAAYSRYTPIKQRELAHFLKIAAAIYPKVAAKWWPGEPITIMDITAGPGIVNGAPGSPLLILQSMAEAGWKLDEPASRLVLCDHDLETASRLYTTIRDHPAVAATGTDLTIAHGDNAEALLAESAARSVGLVYWDGNGKDEIPFEALATFVRIRPRADLLLNPAINADKRAGRDPWKRIDLVCALKPHWSVRYVRTFNDWQFTFLLGSNWSQRAEDTNEWAKRLLPKGWMNADPGEHGYELLRFICTRPEQEELDV